MTPAQIYRMIGAKGQAVTLTRRETGEYDPETSTAPVTETTLSGKGVILPLAGYRKVDGKVIVAGDETLLLAPLTNGGAAMVPQVSDALTDAAGREYTLTLVSPLRPAGTDLVYDCVIRRAV